MYHNQVQLFIRDAGFLCVSSGNSLLVERMENTSSGKLRQPEYLAIGSSSSTTTGSTMKEGTPMESPISLQGCSQVGSVLSLIADFQIVKQFVAHFIGAARDRL